MKKTQWWRRKPLGNGATHEGQDGKKGSLPLDEWGNEWRRSERVQITHERGGIK